mgnify:CR=1 FL=1
MNDIYISENFKLSEFESPDTKEVKVDEKLINKLQQLRNRMGKPLIINSGYRTWEHHVSIYQELYGDAWEDNISEKSLKNFIIKYKQTI